MKVADCRGSAPLSAILKGVDWVVKDAAKAPTTPAVANMSIGGSRSRALDTAVIRAVAKGITFTVAAGNDGKNACGGSPAAVPQALTVGATDAEDRRAPFSDHGPCVDLSAPGVRITSAWKDSTTATARASGTSMAAPHVAGVAALVLARGTARTPAQVSEELLRSAVSDHITGLPAAPRTCCSTPPPDASRAPRLPPRPVGIRWVIRLSLMAHQFLCASGESKSLTSHHGDASISATAPARPPHTAGGGRGSS